MGCPGLCSSILILCNSDHSVNLSKKNPEVHWEEYGRDEDGEFLTEWEEPAVALRAMAVTMIRTSRRSASFEGQVEGRDASRGFLTGRSGRSRR